MPDNQHHNDSLEHLFRKTSDEYDITFHEDDWHRMEEKLDLRDAQLSYKRKVQWIAAAAVLIIAVLGYFTYENHTRLNQINDQIAENRGEQFIPLPDVLPLLPETEQDREPGTPDLQSENGSGVQEITGLAESGEADTHRPVLREVETGRIPLYETDTQFVLAGFEPFQSTLTLPDQTIARTEEIASVKTVPAVVRTKPLFPQPDRDRETIAGRFSLGLMGSPDVSTAGGISNFHDPGYKFGVMLEYAVTERISISAGMIQTVVRYSAPGDRYNPPVYWADGQGPNEITAECLLFDIPLNIRFNILNFDRSRFFASAGFSSYIMLQEDYYFNYDAPTTDQPESWSGRTGTRHWFSNAGFSVGFEYDVHPRWSVRAEPFLKVPIREIGWGNARLYSMGSFLSLNYNL
jgi:hypothetical protein